MCKENKIVVKTVDRKKLDMMCNSSTHQGVAAYAASHEYASMEDVFALAEERGEKPFIIICDELEDPHNLGAILRTAEATGVHSQKAKCFPELCCRKSVGRSGRICPCCQGCKSCPDYG